jgi:hypothetical protein
MIENSQNPNHIEVLPETRRNEILGFFILRTAEVEKLKKLFLQKIGKKNLL